MMEAVRQIAQTHPRLKIDFVETSYGNAAEGFAQGLFDLFFSADSLALRQMGASFTPLSREKYYCVFSPDSPLAKRETISTDLLENITVYAGADYRDVPELHEFESFFARDNVVKESIFREKLTMDCLRGDAVSFFNHSNISKICPPLEARPMEWPPLAYGAHVRPGAPRVVRDVLDACIDSFKRTG